MLESRWGRRAGPALAVVGAMLVVASTALGAPSIEDRPPPECEGPPTAADGVGAWYALEPVLDRGVLDGQRLAVGTLEGPGWTIALPADAWATGPVHGRVLFGSDDGRASRIRAFDAARGCVIALATSSDIVRSAVLDPRGGAIHEHRLARADRSDLGVWRRSIDDGTGVIGHGAADRVLRSAEPDARFGRTWRTDLAWSDDGHSLAVASCGELACRFRVLDRSGLVATLADPDLGALVALADGRLVVRGACRGLPCPVFSVDPTSGDRTTIEAEAGPAAPVEDDGGADLVLAEATGDGDMLLRDVDARTGRGHVAASEAVPVMPSAGYGAELPPGWFLVLAPDADGPAALRAASLEHPARPLHEVQP